MIDLPALDAAVYARIATDAEGATVRGLLGTPTAVMLVEDLRVEGLTVQALPTRPLLALRYAPTPLVGRVIARPVYQWYAYGDISAGYAPLRALVAPVAAAYAVGVGTLSTAGLSVATVAVGDIEVSAGAQLRDERLKLLIQVITVAIGAV